jgi:hypothetical protein
MTASTLPAKNLSVDVKALDHIPKEELFIFQAEPPPPLQAFAVRDPLGAVPLDMVFRLMKQPPRQSPSRPWFSAFAGNGYCRFRSTRG